MPLRVHCPSGCLIHMSSNRAGRIVRCPQCKKAMRIPEVAAEEVALGIPIPVQAKVAIRRDSPEEQASDDVVAAGEPTADEPRPRLVVPELIKPEFKSSALPPKSGLAPDNDEAGDHTNIDHEHNQRRKSSDSEPSDLLDRADQPVTNNDRSPTTYSAVTNESTATNESADLLESEQASTQESTQPTSSDRHELAAADASMENFSTTDRDDVRNPFSDSLRNSTNETLDQVDQPAGIREKKGKNEAPTIDEFLTHSDRSELSKSPTAPVGLETIDIVASSGQAEPPVSIPVINLEPAAEPELVAEDTRSWETRLETANADRKVLARVFAICLCLVALINMVPAIYHWYHWNLQSDSMPLPRWIYILVFVGALHVVYAFFLFQINDWSAMRAVSIAMLAIAFVFGVISTGLLMGGGDGNLSSFLGIPFMLIRQASIWCVAMLVLATLMSYWGGREATNWQRAEHLLKDILARSAA